MIIMPAAAQMAGHMPAGRLKNARVHIRKWGSADLSPDEESGSSAANALNVSDSIKRARPRRSGAPTVSPAIWLCY